MKRLPPSSFIVLALDGVLIVLFLVALRTSSTVLVIATTVGLLVGAAVTVWLARQVPHHLKQSRALWSIADGPLGNRVLLCRDDHVFLLPYRAAPGWVSGRGVIRVEEEAAVAAGRGGPETIAEVFHLNPVTWQVHRVLMPFSGESVAADAPAQADLANVERRGFSKWEITAHRLSRRERATIASLTKITGADEVESPELAKLIDQIGRADSGD